jgi:hypothetical protein
VRIKLIQSSEIPAAFDQRLICEEATGAAPKACIELFSSQLIATESVSLLTAEVTLSRMKANLIHQPRFNPSTREDVGFSKPFTRVAFHTTIQ